MMTSTTSVPDRASDQPSLAFLLCVERGMLERKTLLAVKSIRRFGGRLSSAPIYCFQPRKGYAISSSVRNQLVRLGATLVDVPLNQRYPEYAFANKVFVSGYAEREIDAEFLVFTDSDMIYLREPMHFVLPEGCSVGISPVAKKLIGSDGVSDVNAAYWSQLASLLKIARYRMITTKVDQQHIIGYWNAGLVTDRRAAGVFRTWQDNFITVMESGLRPINDRGQPDITFVEQSALSATIHALEANVFHLPEIYNYPIRSHDLVWDGEQPIGLGELCCIHYHDMFCYPSWHSGAAWVHPLRQLRKLIQGDDAFRWAIDALSRYQVWPQSPLGRAKFAATEPPYRWVEHLSRRLHRRRGATG